MKVFSIIVIILMFLVLVFLTAYLLLMRVFFRRIFGRKNDTIRIEKNAKLLEVFNIDLCWWDKYKFEELTAISEDGLKLKAHYLNQGGKATALLVHGYGSNYKEMQNYAKLFAEMRCNILAVENRGHGKSEGFIGMGWLDKEDVLTWVNLLVEKDALQKILLFGLSMGASAVCMATGLNLPKNVVGTISDCGFNNVYDQIDFVFNPKHQKFKKVLLNEFAKYMKRAYNFDLHLADCGIMLKKSRIPIMFIHGNQDNYVPKENVYKLANNLPEYRKNLYLVEDAGHAKSIVVNYRKYENRVREFLKTTEMKDNFV